MAGTMGAAVTGAVHNIHCKSGQFGPIFSPFAYLVRSEDVEHLDPLHEPHRDVLARKVQSLHAHRELLLLLSLLWHFNNF